MLGEAGSTGAGGPQLEAVLEEMPKWGLVQEVLQVQSSAYSRAFYQGMLSVRTMQLGIKHFIWTAASLLVVDKSVSRHFLAANACV